LLSRRGLRYDMELRHSSNVYWGGHAGYIPLVLQYCHERFLILKRRCDGGA
jgi:hypothetical protein